MNASFNDLPTIGSDESGPPSAGPSGSDARAPAGYEILGELGRGGMGVVYKARHLALNRVVALKMILTGAHAGAAEAARFQAEARAVARLSHPGIVAVHEVGDQDGRPFMALEFCAGGSLERKLAGTPMKDREAADLVKRLAEAVGAAHDARVIHRDLKPANVLLTADGTPKVTDFGLAKQLDEVGHTQTGSIMGTPSYMAPEQAKGAKDIGPAADVYALGAILYECLAGRPPFKAATAYDTIVQVIAEDPLPPRQLNGKVAVDLETIALKCLAKDPGRRYRTAGELADDLGRFLAGEPIRARSVGRLERAWKWARRRPAVASLSGVLVLLTVASVAAITLLYRDALGQAKQARDDRDRALRAEEKSGRLLADVEERLQMSQYGATLARACRVMGERKPDAVAGLLERVPARFRGWEFGHLRLQLAGLRSDAPPTRGVVWSPDGRSLATFGSVFAVWNVAERRQLFATENPENVVTDFSFVPDGRQVAILNGESEPYLCDAVTGEPIRPQAVQVNHRGPTRHQKMMVIGHSGKLLATTDGTNVVRVQDLGGGPGNRSVKTPESIRHLVAHPKRDQLVCVGDTVLTVVDPTRGVVMRTIPLPSGMNAIGATFDPTGARLAVADRDRGVVLVHDAEAGRLQTTIPVGPAGTLLHAALRSGPGGPEVVSVAEPGGVVRHDAATGKVLGRVADVPPGCTRAALSPDGATLACATPGGAFLISLTGTVSVILQPRGWSASLSDDERQTPPTVRVPMELLTLDGESGFRLAETGLPLIRATFTSDEADKRWRSPDGTIEVVAEENELQVRDADAEAGVWRSVLVGHSAPVRQAMFLPGGRLVSLSSKEVKLWSATQGIELYTWAAPGDLDVVRLGFDAGSGAVVLHGSAGLMLYLDGSRPVQPADADRLALLRVLAHPEHSDEARRGHEILRGRHPGNQPLRIQRLEAHLTAGRWAEALVELRDGTELAAAKPLAWWLDVVPETRPTVRATVERFTVPVVSQRDIKVKRSDDAVDADALEVVGVQEKQGAPRSRPSALLAPARELLAALDDALAARPDDAPLLAVRGWLRLRAGSHVDALRDLAAAAAARPDRADLWGLVADAAARANDVPGCRAAYARIQRLACPDLAGWHARAVGRPGRPVSEPTAHLDAYLWLELPGAQRAGALRVRGQLASDASRPGAAARDFAAAAALAPDDFDAARDWAVEALAAGDLAGYRAACRWLMRRPPSGPDRARVAAELCVLGPESLPDPGTVVRLVQLCPPGGDRDLLLAAALLRADRTPEAFRVLRSLRTARPSPAVDAMIRMANQRRGGKEAAAAALQKRTETWEAALARVVAGCSGPAGVLAAAGHGVEWTDPLRTLTWDDWRAVFPAVTELQRLLVVMALSTDNADLAPSLELDETRVRRFLEEHLPGGRAALVAVLRGKQATAGEVVRTVRALRPSVRRDDAVMFYYGGNGAVGDRHGPKLIFPDGTALRRGTLREELLACRAGLTVLLTDACQTRLSDQDDFRIDPIPADLRAEPLAIAPALPRRGQPTALIRDLFFRSGGVVDIAGACPGQEAWSDDKGGGLFTRSLIRSLSLPSKAVAGATTKSVTWEAFFPVLRRDTATGFEEWKRGMLSRYPNAQIRAAGQEPHAYSLGARR